MNYHRVTHANPQHRPGHLAVECPIGVGGVVGKPGFNFESLQGEHVGLGATRSNRRRHVTRITADVVVNFRRLGGSGLADHDQAMHARLAMAGQRAEIIKCALLVGAKYDNGTCAFRQYMIRECLELRHRDIMLGTVPLISVICTTAPGGALSVGLTTPSISPPTPIYPMPAAPMWVLSVYRTSGAVTELGFRQVGTGGPGRLCAHRKQQQAQAESRAPPPSN